MVTFRILIRNLQPVGAIECYQPYWHGDDGEDAWGTDRSSPFQQSWRSGPRGVLVYDIPVSDPIRLPASDPHSAGRVKTANHLNQVAECRIPAASTEMEVLPQGVFARYGPVFVALRSLAQVPIEVNRHPLAPNLAGFMTIKIRAARSAIYYRVEPAAAGSTLRQFEQSVLTDDIRYSPDEDTARFPGNNGRAVTARFNLSRFSSPPPPSPDVVATSPIFNWSNGQVTFRAEEGSR